MLNNYWLTKWRGEKREGRKKWTIGIWRKTGARLKPSKILVLLRVAEAMSPLQVRMGYFPCQILVDLLLGEATLVKSKKQELSLIQVVHNLKVS